MIDGDYHRWFNDDGIHAGLFTINSDELSGTWWYDDYESDVFTWTKTSGSDIRYSSLVEATTTDETSTDETNTDETTTDETTTDETSTDDNTTEQTYAQEGESCDDSSV